MYTIGGTINWCRYYEKYYELVLKILRIEVPYDPGIPLLGIYLKNTKPLIQKLYAPLCSLQCYLQ